MTSVTTRPRNLDETNSANAGPKAPAILHTAGTPHERLLFVMTSLVGKVVTVQTKDGKEYEGILQACMTEKEMGVILALARQKVAPDDPAPKPINELRAEEEEIKAIDSTITEGWLKIDAKPIKNALTTSAAMWSATHTTYLKEHVENQLSTLSEFIERVASGLAGEVEENDQTQLIQAMTYVRDVRLRTAQYDNLLDRKSVV